VSVSAEAGAAVSVAAGAVVVAAGPRMAHVGTLALSKPSDSGRGRAVVHFSYECVHSRNSSTLHGLLYRIRRNSACALWISMYVVFGVPFVKTQIPDKNFRYN
jgi:hypothetical protein